MHLQVRQLVRKYHQILCIWTENARGERVYVCTVLFAPCTSVLWVNPVSHAWRPLSLSLRSIPYFSCLCIWDVLFYLPAIDQGLGDWWAHISHSLPIYQLPGVEDRKLLCTHTHTHLKMHTTNKANQTLDLSPMNFDITPVMLNVVLEACL